MTGDLDAALRAVDEATGGWSVFADLTETLRSALEEEVSWTQVNGGDRLFRQGDAGDALFVVITGHLQAVLETASGESRVVGDIARGEVVGEMALLTGDPRSVTVRALRDSTLVRFSSKAFELVTERNTKAMLAVTRRIIRRLEQSNAGTRPAARLATIAVVPASDGADHRDVAARVVCALKAIGPAEPLTRELVERAIEGLDPIAAARWLDDQERHHAYTVYVADDTATPWTARCIRQADRVLLVVNGDAPPVPDCVARLSADAGLQPRLGNAELVLLHAPTTDRPRHTAAWLDITGASACHHVSVGKPEDYERIGRFLTGRAVGLVLGGGGARGFAHIGVIRAFQEAGLPIDAVGGTSMGAIIAAQCAMRLDADALTALNRRHWVGDNPLKDKTLPVVALLTGRRLERMVGDMFDELEIPDLWRRYFCVSADLTHATLRVHDRGRLSRATRASMSLPGMAIPVYDEGALLVDGGVLNNLPADVMKAASGGRVVAVNVTPDKDLSVSGPYPEAMSGWKLLLGRQAVKLPGILAIMMRTTMLASTHRRDRVARDIDLLMNPPVERFGMFDWERLDDIAAAGYDCARSALAGWRPA